MHKRHLYGLATVLTVLGLGLFLYKALAMDFPLRPGSTEEIWDIETRLRFTARGEAVKASLFIPTNLHPYAVVDEQFVSRGYGLTTTRTEGNRQSVWAIRKASGPQALYYRGIVQRGVRPAPEGSKTTPAIQPPALDEAQLAAARGLLDDIRAQSADLDTLVAQLLQRLAQSASGTDTAVLLAPGADVLKRIEIAVQVLALAGVPARLVRGVDLGVDTRDATFIPWLQVFKDGGWQYYSPDAGEAGRPAGYLMLWRGSEPMYQITGASKPKATVSVRRSTQAQVTAAAVRAGILSPRLREFSLLSLPVQTQEVYRVLLVIPIGALLIVFMRNVIGIKTFGTFMPVLIALAFRETQLLGGIVLFSLIVALGLSIRFYLDKLKLLLVPRLGAVLTVVVMLMAMVTILSHKLGLELGLSIALFPMVIMTMTIERMSIVWDERGASEALQQGAGSLAVAALAYLVMSNAQVVHLAFVFPELLFIVLAVMLLMGRYSGYRLLELRRFKVLAREAR